MAIICLPLSIFAKVMAAAAMASVGMLVLGIWILVLLHIIVVAKAFQRHWFASRGSFAVNYNYYLRRRRRISSTSTGLSAEELENLPSFPFHDTGEDDDAGGRRRPPPGDSVVDCAVCLEIFRRGEKCRMLPACKHSFHARCVDAWLLITPLCPICRTIAGAPPLPPSSSAIPMAW